MAAGLIGGLVVAFAIANLVTSSIEVSFKGIGFTDEELERIEATCEANADAAEAAGRRSYEAAYEKCENRLRLEINPDPLPPD